MKAVGKIEWATKAVKDMHRLAAPARERIVAKVEQYAAVRLSCASVGQPRVRVAGRRSIVVR